MREHDLEESNRLISSLVKADEEPNDRLDASKKRARAAAALVLSSISFFSSLTYVALFFSTSQKADWNAVTASILLAAWPVLSLGFVCYNFDSFCDSDKELEYHARFDIRAEVKKEFMILDKKEQEKTPVPFFMKIL